MGYGRVVQSVYTTKVFFGVGKGGDQCGKTRSAFLGANPACIQPPPAREKRGRRRVVMDALPPLTTGGESLLYALAGIHPKVYAGKRAMRGDRGRKDGPEDVIVYCTKMRRCFEKARKGFLFARREMISEFKWRSSPPSFTVCLHAQ